ncbi:MAG: LacI family DNA-binding transcriptional regulator [Lentisphaeria bacterium]|nr:LacI family DNA-binding transcriptional regulator [Lentisphaeria bacterium]
MDKTTLKDIAETTGFSISTVSRVLADSPRISRDTRRIVLAAAEKFHYKPRTKNVALIVFSPTLTGYLGRLCSAVTGELMKHGFNPVIIQMEHIECIRDIPICGAISIATVNKLARIWGEMHERPLISLNSQSNHLDNIYRLSSNEFQGMKILVDRLKENGHTRIARLGSEHTFHPLDNWSCQRRNAAFLKLAEQYGLTSDLYAESEHTLPAVLNAISNLMTHKPTALLIQTEDYLLPVLQSLKLLKIRVPEDLSLAAWSSEDIHDHLYPPPFAVSQDYGKFGELAVQTLKSLIDGDNQPTDLEVDYKILPGQSVIPCPRKRRK